MILVAPPPDFRKTPPLFESWPRHATIVRIFDSTYPPNAFHPGEKPPEIRGRFHFFSKADGGVVAVLYGSDREDGAISETIFHDVPVRGNLRTIQESRLEQLRLVTLKPLRDLKLVQLLGHGLRRLQLRPQDLTDTDSDQYPHTVPWAKALYDVFADLDGLVWMSRQFNAAKSIVLFGDRVPPSELEVTSIPLPLRLGPGRARLERAANQAGVLIV